MGIDLGVLVLRATTLTLGLGAVALYLPGAGAFSLDQTLGLSYGRPVRITALGLAILGTVAAAWWRIPAPMRQPTRT